MFKRGFVAYCAFLIFLLPPERSRSKLSNRLSHFKNTLPQHVTKNYRSCANFKIIFPYLFVLFSLLKISILFPLSSSSLNHKWTRNDFETHPSKQMEAVSGALVGFSAPSPILWDLHSWCRLSGLPRATFCRSFDVFTIVLDFLKIWAGCLSGFRTCKIWTFFTVFKCF